jgi:hypothetical protein
VDPFGLWGCANSTELYFGEDVSIEDFEVCRECGGAMQRVSPVDKSPLIMECQGCGHREWAEIQVPPPWRGDERGVEYKRVVVYRAEGPAKAEELQALRKLSEELGTLPVAEAAKTVASSQTIDLGTHPLQDAQALLKRAEALSLKAGLELPEEQSIGSQDKGLRFFEPFGAPVTVGGLGEDSKVIPFGWIGMGGAAILAVMIVLLLSC